MELGVSAIVPHGRNFSRAVAGRGGGWRLRGGRQGFLPRQVLERLVEQTMGDEEEIFKVSFQDRVGFNSASWSRTAKRGSGGAVLRRDAAPGRSRAVLTWKFGHYFYELLFWQALAFVYMRQLRRLVE